MSKYKGLKTLEVLEGSVNYNAWIAERLKPHITSPALEVGSGTGNLSQFFTKLRSLTLTDNDKHLVDILLKKFSQNKNVSVEVFDIEKKSSRMRNKFNTIFSVNVLEHIKDDEAALKNMHALLNTKGKVVLLVPAKKFAYTDLDKKLGHCRRYEKKELYEKMIRAGFKVENIVYFNAVGLLSWIVRDKISKADHIRPYQAKLFDKLTPLLKTIEPASRLPIGISLIAVGLKE